VVSTTHPSLVTKLNTQYSYTSITLLVFIFCCRVNFNFTDGKTFVWIATVLKGNMINIK